MRMSDQQAWELLETLPEHVAEFDEPGIEQAVASCGAADALEQTAALLNSRAKEVLQKIFKTTAPLSAVIAKTETEIQHRIAQVVGTVQASAKGIADAPLSLFHW
jgi:hypothetical protein